MPAGQRFALLCIALLVSLSLYVKGRLPTATGGGAAFFRGRPGTVTVRLSGELARPGVYRFPQGTTVADAIKMTVPEAATSAALAGGGAGRLASGDLLTFGWRDRQLTLCTRTRMKAKELILLEIPLEVDLLEADEWDCLPGIGPVLAARIVADRQKNGAFGSLDGLQRVPGVGAGKLAAIRKYFVVP